MMAYRGDVIRRQDADEAALGVLVGFGKEGVQGGLVHHAEGGLFPSASQREAMRSDTPSFSAYAIGPIVTLLWGTDVPVSAPASSTAVREGLGPAASFGPLFGPRLCASGPRPGRLVFSTLPGNFPG